MKEQTKIFYEEIVSFNGNKFNSTFYKGGFGCNPSVL